MSYINEQNTHKDYSKARQLKAVFGGTFDPPHIGHLSPLQALLDSLDIDNCELIPAHIPVHKNVSTSAHHRLNMTRLLAADDERLHVNEIEIHRHRPSYTVDTLKELKRQFPQRALCFVMGLDAFAGLASWHQSRKILAQSHVIVMFREQTLGDATVANSIQSSLSQALSEQAQDMKLSKVSSLALHLEALGALPDSLKALLPRKIYLQAARNSLFTSHSQKECIEHTQSPDINGILRASESGQLVFFANDREDVSSSQLREALKLTLDKPDAKQAAALKYLSADVAKYIRDNQLY